MSNESQEVALLDDITEDKWPEIYGVGKVNDYYERVKAEVLSVVPDLTTQKGRDAIASNSRKVSTSKTFVEKPGRAYLKYIKETKCAAIEKELREFVDLMDKLRDDTRKPLTDYEAEQARIKAEEEARLAQEALLLQIENDHEIALLLHEKYERERAEKVAAEEKSRMDYEAKIAADAEENARIAAEQAAANAILDAQLATERAQREKAESEAREKQAVIDAQARELAQKQATELAIKQAAEHAEQQRLQAIADTEARIAREKAAEEAAAAKLAANKANQKRKNNEAKLALVEFGLTEDMAMELIVKIVRCEIPNIKINY